MCLQGVVCLNRSSTGWRPAPYPDCDARITAQPSRTGRDTLKRNFVTWFSDPHPWLSYVGRTPWRVQSCKWLVNDSSTCQDQRSRFGGNHARCDYLATAPLALNLTLAKSFLGASLRLKLASHAFFRVSLNFPSMQAAAPASLASAPCPGHDARTDACASAENRTRYASTLR